MKKFGQIVLVFLLSVGMFTGCGTSYKADESTVFVLKDGKIVSTDVENFDEKTYDKDGLKEYVKNEIDTYNEKNGKPAYPQENSGSYDAQACFHRQEKCHEINNRQKHTLTITPPPWWSNFLQETFHGFEEFYKTFDLSECKYTDPG